MSDTADTDLLSFFYACPVGLVKFDAGGDISMVNPHAMKHLFPLAGAAGVSNFFSATQRYAPELRNLVQAFGPTSGQICDGHRITVQFGEQRQRGLPTVIACSIVRLAQNRLMATLSDISEQVVQERRLRQADTWFSALVGEVNGHALLTLTGEGRIAAVSKSFTRQTGFCGEAIVGRPVASVLTETVDASGRVVPIEEQLYLAARDGWHLFEGWEKRADGERYWAQRLIVSQGDQKDEAETGFSLVLPDVPARGAGSDDLVRLLTRDHLTGASNRMLFDKALRQEQMNWSLRQRPISLVMMDLDHFKAINDDHGHGVGDEVLKKVASLANEMLPMAGIFARLGGEEFAVLLPDHDLGMAFAFAEQLRAGIAAMRIAVPGTRIGITASMGCAQLTEVDGSIEAFLALADERLYAAKRGGRDQMFVQAA